jgi:hypothetical protein
MKIEPPSGGAPVVAAVTLNAVQGDDGVPVTVGAGLARVLVGVLNSSTLPLAPSPVT